MSFHYSSNSRPKKKRESHTHLVLDVSGLDGNAASLLFRCLVNVSVGKLLGATSLSKDLRGEKPGARGGERGVSTR